MYPQSEKNLLNIDTSSTCPANMVNFGLLTAELVSWSLTSLFSTNMAISETILTAEIRWRVWGTPANFNGFRVLAALLHGTYSSGRQPNFAALNRGRHLYSAGRRSLWALAHILVCIVSALLRLHVE